MATQRQIDQMRERITDEIFLALGLRKDGIPRRLFGRLFYLPTSRFVHMFAEADAAVESEGLPGGCRVVMEGFRVKLEVNGVEHLAGEGPLMILSNHPGAYDSVAIGSLVERKDFRFIVYEIPFYRTLPNISSRLIYVPKDTSGRMLALRTAIQHLQEGGALLQFGAGTIEPDPAVQPGAIEWLSRWSSSVEIMLRKAPETRVVLTIASGVLLKRFFNHPLAAIRRHPVARRRVAEFMQVLQQLTIPRSVSAQARLHFSRPLAAAELIQEAGRGRLMPVLLDRVRALLSEQAAAANLML